MAKRKVCTHCKLFVEKEVCPQCKGNKFSTNWQGRMFVNNPDKSLIAQKMSLKMKGEYAIKVR
jgi:DNA-directed RNA polymerase subunit E"